MELPIDNQGTITSPIASSIKEKMATKPPVKKEMATIINYPKFDWVKDDQASLYTDYL